MAPIYTNATSNNEIHNSTNNYDQKSDMHNILLGVLAMATTVTAMWWQGRDNRGRRNARVSIHDPIVELDDLPASQVNASGLNQLVTPANTTQDAREHSITDVEGVIPHLTMVHPVEEVMQET
ncbi:hypothetical protein LTR22_012769 [Elasticomyces elasticus]|nr:hypothetical protein LTR22_012769 [Elasticomyces elasticus]KAK4918156.1 hypothetical protein LTR49_014012 [Elasticomyces elasticus]KAK5757702.1 hypothetical protein LTS12_012161 [Elasticomyces elasticus]